MATIIGFVFVLFLLVLTFVVSWLANHTDATFEHSRHLRTDA